MANQIKVLTLRILTYENFPGGHPSQGGACLTAGAVSIPLEISLTLPLPPALSPAEIVLPVKIWHKTFTAHMANQIKRHNVSSLTYENFPGGHPSQYCSHPCTLNSTALKIKRVSDLSARDFGCSNCSSKSKDACIEDKRQYRAPHLPDGLLLAAMSRVDSYHIS
ncbi:hypothetical protein F511_11132 [Dorcoceras hygrometricum]|uniref:Uncharacterized protein n=1 Tax=Dorcoceras hygrometricum TaxID=472368 RepID=A0A2Z7A420_9LAMI|nr:hypothetical protein F511_11132 [Dorcoceras hygrometricum]